MATKRAASSSTINPEQKRRDIEKYSESIFYSARYSGKLMSATYGLDCSAPGASSLDFSRDGLNASRDSLHSHDWATGA